MSDDGLGWGAGGMAAAMQLYSNLQGQKVEQEEAKVKLEADQLSLNNLKKFQAAMSSKQFSGLTSNDPQEQTNAMMQAATEALHDGMPTQAGQIANMASNIATSRAYMTEQQATATQRYVDMAEKLFSGIDPDSPDAPAQWHAAQQFLQSELPPEAMRNPTIKGLLTSGYSPDKIRILPEFLDRLKARAQLTLDQANRARTYADERKAELDAAKDEADIEYTKVRAAYLRMQGADPDKTDGSPDGDKMSRLRWLVGSGGVSLPMASRSVAARNQFFADAVRNNPSLSADEIFAKIRAGQITMAGTLSEARSVGTAGGKAAYGGADLENIIPLVQQASDAVPRGQFRPVSWLLQAADTQLSSPQLKQLKIQINSALNAYDVLAARGGTDKEKREETRRLLTSADSQEALDAGLVAFRREAEAAQTAAEEALHRVAGEGRTGPSSRVFATQAAAEAAFKAGRIKKGDSITVAGRTGTVQ